MLREDEDKFPTFGDRSADLDGIVDKTLSAGHTVEELLERMAFLNQKCIVKSSRREYLRLS